MLGWSEREPEDRPAADIPEMAHSNQQGRKSACGAAALVADRHPVGSFAGSLRLLELSPQCCVATCMCCNCCLPGTYISKSPSSFIEIDRLHIP